MLDENSTTEDEGVDLEELVGNVLESRGLTKERLEGLDGLGAKLDGLIASAGKPRVANGGGKTSPAFDEDAFLARVGGIVDEKLAVVSAPKAKPLRRWLGI